eukprot:scpid50367/ scgid5274/ 
MLLLPKELALFLVCIGQGGLPSGVQAASLSQIELADALDAIASPGQDSHSWLEHTAAAIPAIAALCLFVVCIALCAGRKQQCKYNHVHDYCVHALVPAFPPESSRILVWTIHGAHTFHFTDDVHDCHVLLPWLSSVPMPWHQSR